MKKVQSLTAGLILLLSVVPYTVIEHKEILAPLQIQQCIPVTVTIYQGDQGQTDHTPNVTASGTVFDPKDPPRWIAVSPDLLSLYPYGSKVYLQGVDVHDGIYTVMDKTASRFKSHVDILVSTSIAPGDREYGYWKKVSLYGM